MKNDAGVHLLVKLSIIGFLIVVLLAPEPTEARPKPSWFTSTRHKRLSDQRLAELETLMGLSRMKGILLTVPVGFGKVDPARVGRKRRSSPETGVERWRRVLNVWPSEESSINEKSDSSLPLVVTFLKNKVEGSEVSSADEPYMNW